MSIKLYSDDLGNVCFSVQGLERKFRPEEVEFISSPTFVQVEVPRVTKGEKTTILCKFTINTILNKSGTRLFTSDAADTNAERDRLKEWKDALGINAQSLINLRQALDELPPVPPTVLPVTELTSSIITTAETEFNLLTFDPTGITDDRAYYVTINVNTDTFVAGTVITFSISGYVFMALVPPPNAKRMVFRLDFNKTGNNLAFKVIDSDYHLLQPDGFPLPNTINLNAEDWVVKATYNGASSMITSVDISRIK